MTQGYVSGVDRALRSGRDVWGDDLLRSRAGPTYEGVRRYLKPLFFAHQPRRLLTESGAYYLPFGLPAGPWGAGSVALHLADGSQILSERADGPRLTVDVGGERYGSCLARLATPSLYRGYLPILRTRYKGSDGTRYLQESFVARIPETSSIVSLVRLTVNGGVAVRLRPSWRRLSDAGGRLVRGGKTYLYFSTGGRFDGSSVVYPTGRARRSIYVAWLAHPGSARAFTLDRARFGRARRSVIEFWNRRLAEGTTFEVPEQRVLDAERNLLIQNLVLGWRYSIGNAYEEFSYPESIDVAQVMADYGFDRIARATLTKSLWMTPARYPNWQMGEKLLGSARYFQLFRDGPYVAKATRVLEGYVAALGHNLESRGLLARERYSSDIADPVYGLHSQAVVWQGLEAMAGVWAATGRRDLARRAESLARRLATGLRAAVRRSARSLPDGSLFIPVRLLDREEAYEAVTASRPGSYWNLVAPYALASGLFAPGGAEAEGALRYVLGHGSRSLGLVRAGAFALYGKDRAYPVSGTDNVYGINASRFLADNDQPDQLVLALYGALAAGMTPGTFVSGEGATISPLHGQYYRSMYQPPNSASNSAFLETLRLMLVHQTVSGLELAYATPRAWLVPGRRIAVRGAPTAFGPVSFSLESAAGSIHAHLVVPARPRPATLRLRLRLPVGNRITGLTLGGRAFRRFDPATATIDLSGLRGDLSIVARYGKG